MPSSRRGRRQQPYEPLDLSRLAGMPRRVTLRGDEYSVQRVSGGAKSYLCPGCHHVIPPGTAHIVAFPVSAPFGVDIGVEARRHWHSGCWSSGARPS